MNDLERWAWRLASRAASAAKQRLDEELWDSGEDTERALRDRLYDLLMRGLVSGAICRDDPTSQG